MITRIATIAFFTVFAIQTLIPVGTVVLCVLAAIVALAMVIER